MAAVISVSPPGPEPKLTEFTGDASRLEATYIIGKITMVSCRFNRVKLVNFDDAPEHRFSSFSEAKTFKDQHPEYQFITDLRELDEYWHGAYLVDRNRHLIPCIQRSCSIKATIPRGDYLSIAWEQKAARLSG